MLTRYALIAALAAAIGAGSWITWLQIENHNLKAENERLQNKVETFSERMRNIMEDREDDATVDHPSDFDPPSDWLRPEP